MVSVKDSKLRQLALPTRSAASWLRVYVRLLRLARAHADLVSTNLDCGSNVQCCLRSVHNKLSLQGVPPSLFQYDFATQRACHLCTFSQL